MGALEACRLLSIEEIVIENGMVRGLSADHTAAVLSTKCPDMFGPVGITRVGTLFSRLGAILKSGGSVEVEVKPTTGEVFQIVGRGKGSSIDFRCASAKKVKAPSEIDDEPARALTFTQEEIASISQGTRMMGAKSFSLRRMNGRTTAKCMDPTGDVFTATLVSDVVPFDVGAPTDFQEFRYRTESLLAPFKHMTAKDDTLPITAVMGDGGSLRFLVNGHEVVVLPENESSGEE